VRTLPRHLAIAIALPLALVLLPACGDAGAGADGSSSAVGSPSPTSSLAGSPSPSIDAEPSETESSGPGGARCTLVLGMSVTANWFLDGGFESLPGIDDAGWELIWESRHDVGLYADPGARPYSDAPASPCGEDPDRVLFQIAAFDWRSPGAVIAELGASIDNIRAVWPTVRVIELIPIVGGPGSGPCHDPDVPDKGVQASFMNPAMVDAITEVANGADIVAGPDLLVADCAQFRDGPGHLTTEGASYIASVLAKHYGS
jgi:hypothetical protein